MANGFDKVDQVEKAINSGDAKVADGVLKTIEDPTSQAIFKNIITQDCNAGNVLPPCTIDEGGIHFGGEHKMTMVSQDGKLGMRDDQQSSFDKFKQGVSETFDSLKESIKDFNPADGLGGLAGGAADKIRDNPHR